MTHRPKKKDLLLLSGSVINLVKLQIEPDVLE